MKCQSLLSEKNKKNIVNYLSAELAQRVVKVDISTSVAPDKAIFADKKSMVIFLISP